MENVGEKIYNLRKEKKISQEKLAEALNVTRQTVSKWERDVVNPETQSIIALINYFGVEPSYFFSQKEIEEIELKIAEPTKTEIAETDTVDKKKLSRFKILKLYCIVIGMVLLVLSVIACGIAVYLVIDTESFPYFDSVYSIDYGGIVVLVVGVIVTAILITSIVLIIIKVIKGKKNKNKP